LQYFLCGIVTKKRQYFLKKCGRFLLQMMLVATEAAPADV